MSQSYYVTENEDDLKKYRDAYVGYIKTFTQYYRSQYPEGQGSTFFIQMGFVLYRDVISDEKSLIKP